MTRTLAHTGNPFRRGTVALLLLVGAGAFLLLLYALGQGWTGQQDRNGGEHGASTGLTGFAGLAKLMEGRGHDVTLSRSAGRFATRDLLVLTPPLFADGEALARILQQRRFRGPTLLILPKWFARPIPDAVQVERRPGWVLLGDASSPGWVADLLPVLGLTPPLALAVGQTGGWEGYGTSGALPDPAKVQALVGDGKAGLDPLVLDSEGDVLAGIVYPADENAFPVVIVFEPDLANNYGLADETRARIAARIVTSAAGKERAPLVFDLTLPGLGASENLLTLAFRPPFLAATLCLLLAALVIAWRGFARFGPARLPDFAAAADPGSDPALAQGKRQLVLNGAALLARVRRWHLLREPYAALVAARIARTLNLREPAGEARELAIDRALSRLDPGNPDFAGSGFAASARRLREAEGAGEILRAARALQTLERTLTR